MLTPYKYQLQAIKAGKDRNIAIFDEPGLGKSIQAIEIGKRLRKESLFPDHSNLILSTKSSLKQWADYISSQEGGFAFIPQSKVPRSMNNGDLWIVTNYEGIRFLDPYHFFKLIVVDEAHKIANPSSQRTKAIKRLRAHRKIALTGTPADKHSASDLWSIFNWLYPNKFHFSGRKVFLDQYANYDHVWTKSGLVQKYLTGSRDPFNLARLMEGFVFQRTKQQVAKDLPPLIENVVHLEMFPSQQKLYNEIDQCEDIEIGDFYIPNEAARLTLLQKVGSYVPQKESVKIDWVVDYCNNRTRERIIIFAKFIDTCHRVSELLTSDRVFSDFNQLSGHRILVGSIDKMAESLNLGDYSTVIFIDCHSSSRKMEQALNRLHRIDITEPKYAIYLLSSPVDEMIYKSIKAKKSENELIYEFSRRMQRRRV